jgi:hypothetical protein
MTAELLSTCLEPVARQVSIENFAGEWLVDGIPVNLREDVAFGDREELPQFVAVCGVRVDVRGARPPQCREGRRGNKPKPLLCGVLAPAGHQGLFKTRRDDVDHVLSFSSIDGQW